MVKYCPECGTKIEDNPNFCPQCGNKISDEIHINKIDAEEKIADSNEISVVEEKSSKNSFKKIGLILAIIIMATISILVLIENSNINLFGLTQSESDKFVGTWLLVDYDISDIDDTFLNYIDYDVIYTFFPDGRIRVKVIISDESEGRWGEYSVIGDKLYIEGINPDKPGGYIDYEFLNDGNRLRLAWDKGTIILQRAY